MLDIRRGDCILTSRVITALEVLLNDDELPMPEEKLLGMETVGVLDDDDEKGDDEVWGTDDETVIGGEIGADSVAGTGWKKYQEGVEFRATRDIHDMSSLLCFPVPLAFILLL